MDRLCVGFACWAFVCWAFVCGRTYHFAKLHRASKPRGRMHNILGFNKYLPVTFCRLAKMMALPTVANVFCQNCRDELFGRSHVDSERPCKMLGKMLDNAINPSLKVGTFYD